MMVLGQNMEKKEKTEKEKRAEKGERKGRAGAHVLCYPFFGVDLTLFWVGLTLFCQTKKQKCFRCDRSFDDPRDGPLTIFAKQTVSKTSAKGVTIPHRYRPQPILFLNKQWAPHCSESQNCPARSGPGSVVSESATSLPVNPRPPPCSRCRRRR